MARLVKPTVTNKVEQLGSVLSELAALYGDPAKAAAFARNKGALSTALTKHQLLCSALVSPAIKVPRTEKKRRNHA